MKSDKALNDPGNEKNISSRLLICVTGAMKDKKYKSRGNQKQHTHQVAHQAETVFQKKHITNVLEQATLGPYGLWPYKALQGSLPKLA
jgi:hypothetical protein